MRGPKLLLSVVVLALFAFSSCTSDKLSDQVYTSKDLPLSGLQVVPQKQVAGNGTMDVVYNKDLRTLYYTIRWNSLTGNATAARIHGTADKGFNAAPLQDFGSAFPKQPAGTFSGSVLIDGVVFKEEDLLLGRYYVLISTSANNTGEIRGQIEGLK